MIFDVGSLNIIPRLCTLIDHKEKKVLGQGIAPDAGTEIFTHEFPFHFKGKICFKVRVRQAVVKVRVNLQHINLSQCMSSDAADTRLCTGENCIVNVTCWR